MLGTCMKLLTLLSHSFSSVYLILGQILPRVTSTGIEASCKSLNSLFLDQVLYLAY